MVLHLEPVHTLEKKPGYYVELSMQSLNRQPTLMTVWVLNRMINNAEGMAGDKRIGTLQAVSTHPKADGQVRISAEEFLTH